MSSTCPVCKLKCSRKDVMLRHKRNKHGTTHPYPQSSDAYPPLREGYTPPPPMREGNTPQPPPPPQQPYSQSNEEEPYYILKTNNPYTFHVPDGYDPDHFMPWVHPFTSVISGPTGSGKSVFVRRFVHNIKHMMTPIPDRILWCYGEYQTLYGTVDGVDFQQGLPDLDTLDPREKHLIILDDPRQSHGRNGSKSSFSVYEESPQKHQSQCPLHGRLQKPERRIADHGLGASNVSPKDEILFGSLHRSHCSKKAILQKGGFLGSLLAPIASVVAPLLSTLFQ